MPNYGIPGVTADRRHARLVGAAAIAVVTLLALATIVSRGTSDDGVRIILRTSTVGDGVVEGTPVRLDGVEVGRVTDISPADRGTQNIAVRLASARLPGLDSSLRVDYSTGNLFGISEIELRRGPGGPPLRPGTVLQLTAPGAVYDATMGNLLRGISQAGDAVLTPRMASLLATLAADTRAFTPFLESVVTLARTVTEVQRVPISLVLGRFGTTLDGGGDFLDSLVDLIDRVYRIQTLHTDRDRINGGISMVVDQLLPGVAQTLRYAENGFAGYTGLAIPVLDMVAGTVPDSRRSGAELRELIERMGHALPDTPDGPVLQTDLDLHDLTEGGGR
ncbi:ABC-type transporter Mla subunit MlaD [Nocardia transvalensis]|uniref:ABC-type transporter Mla subunit MlaD n=1 Tax=Nocardia transvalensis TaxID=37333 RepID=A0A7W9PAY4_9NOCA|nr:MlaD family protein [Nocardia transvalensis]MBB5912665.1 ABC-type transporter Mla subunit MlaD [Nocardia transvalensis]